MDFSPELDASRSYVGYPATKAFSEIPTLSLPKGRDPYCYDGACFRDVSNAVSSLGMPIGKAVSPTRRETSLKLVVAIEIPRSARDFSEDLHLATESPLF